MKIIKGNSTFELTSEALDKLMTTFNKVEIDLGTGDGRFIYKSALKNPKNLYIGIDPSQKQLEVYSKKALRKKLNNTLFVINSAEMLPKEIIASADTLYIILPWGTLLQYVAKPQTQEIKKIVNLLKPGGILKIILGYAHTTEPSEFERLELAHIDSTHIKGVLVPKYKEIGLNLCNLQKLTKDDLKNFESTWCKKLAFGKERPLFLLEFIKE